MARKTPVLVLLVGLLMYPYWSAFSQSASVPEVRHENITLSALLRQLSVDYDQPIVFSSSQVPDKQISVNISGSLDEVLQSILVNSGLTFMSTNGRYIIIPDEREVRRRYVRGFVQDAATGERLIGAHVWIEGTETGVSTNASGYFRMQASGTSNTIVVSYLGYETASVSLRTGSDEPMTIFLERALTLDEIVIYSDDRPVRAGERLDRFEIVPSSDPRLVGLGGMLDIQQALSTQPGVLTGTDGVGGLSVRGGSYDQNLVLLDGVPLYSPSHAAGIVSVINPLTIKHLAFEKGISQAEYSGRLSSVMNVKTKSGNLNKWAFNGSLGNMSGDILLEGPIIPGKVSILVSGRAFLPGPYLKRISEREKARDGLTGNTQYNFRDFSARISARLTDKDLVDVSFYRSTDEYADVTGERTVLSQSNVYEEYRKHVRWGNTVLSARWNRVMGTRAFSSLTVARTNFELQSLDISEFSQRFFSPNIVARGFVNREFKSVIDDYSLRWNIDYLLNSALEFSAGVVAIHHTIKPKSVAFDDKLEIAGFQIDEATLDDALFSRLYQRSWETGVYGEGRWTNGDNLDIRAGLHVSSFSSEEAFYIDPQPRLTVIYRPTDFLTLDFSAVKSVQYLHLLTSSGIGLPTDLWVASTEDVKPQRSYQVSLASEWKLPAGMVAGWNLYYKSLDHLTAFAEGASFLLGEGTVAAGIVDATDWQQKVVQGSGEALGSEWSLSVPYGKGEFTAAYTLSRSERQFETINNGNPFPFRFDRPHALDLGLLLNISEVFRVSASWNYGSGTPITLALSQFPYESSSGSINGVRVIEYGERNGFRLPSYHRLNLGMTATWRRPKASHSLNLQLYNVYNRQNVVQIALTENPETNTFNYRQFTVLPFIPSLSYQIRL